MLEAVAIYDPESATLSSYLKLWGTRGSVSVSGGAYAAHGGDTCCLEIRADDQLVIIDAGTGIRNLGLDLMRKGFREIHLILGHTHWDHIMGFPFFAPVHFSESTIHIYAHLPTQESLKQKLATVLDPAYFPVGLGKLHSKLHFHHLSLTDPLEIGPIRVSIALANHPGGALGFLVEKGGARIGYVTDNEVLEGFLDFPGEIKIDDERLKKQRPLIELLQGCCPLIHEAQYTPRLYAKRIGWGHSSLSNATLFAKLCGATDWIVTHHDPLDSDDDLRVKQGIHWQIFKEFNYDCRLQMAFDGMVLPLP